MPTVLGMIMVDVPYVMVSVMPQNSLAGEVVVTGLPCNENK
jgi:hypothetical protein